MILLTLAVDTMKETLWLQTQGLHVTTLEDQDATGPRHPSLKEINTFCYLVDKTMDLRRSTYRRPKYKKLSLKSRWRLFFNILHLSKICERKGMLKLQRIQLRCTAS